MAILELAMVTGAIVEMGAEALAKKLDRRETIIKIFKHLKIEKEPSADDFDAIYAYALVEYGTFKPEPILNLFRVEFIRKAFREAFYKNDFRILDREVEGVLQWNEETGELGHIVGGVRNELTAFIATFNDIVDRNRTPTEVKRDQSLDALHQGMGEAQRKLDELIFKVDRLNGEYPPLPVDGVQNPPLTSPRPEWVQGGLIYQLDLPEDIEQLKTILSKWEFVTTSPTQPSIAIANERIGIGHNDGVTFNLSPVKPINNCSVECEVQIIDNGNDLSNWAGIRVRALNFCYDFRLGYLVYLRRMGTVELYGPEGIIDGRDRVKIPNTVDVWTHIRLDILDSEIRVYVDREQEPHIRTIDKAFGGKGLIYLHTFGTHSQFRNFRVYALERRA